MPLKTILTALTSDVTARKLSDVAAGLATQSGAHLTGVSAQAAIAIAAPAGIDFPAEMLSAATEAQRSEAAHLRDIFETAVSGAVPCDWRNLRVDRGALGDQIAGLARSTDLAVLAAEDPEIDRPETASIPTQVIRHSGRPVLVVPRKGAAAAPGASVVIGWSGTREAARAAFDALALLQPGAAVTLLTITHARAPDTATGDSAEALAQAFARHGHKAEVVHRSAEGQSVARTLLQEASDRDASFVATGAFGHSRTYDFIIGAATRELLTTLDRPVLFSK